MEKVILKDQQATIDFGQKLGSYLQPGDLITMEGDLGAGKTTMTKGIGLALGVKRVINSPTFNILKGYQGKIPLYHLDVYRLEGVSQELGFEEYFDGDGVCVVEWAQFIEEELPSDRLEIIIHHCPEGREVELHPKGKRYEDMVRKVLS